MTSYAGLTPDDEVAPPRRNGELIFEAPWEGRIFAVTVAMVERGLFEWGAFRALLVEETADDDAAERAGQPPRPYYVRWERAVERLLTELGTVGGPELTAATEAAIAEDHHADRAARLELQGRPVLSGGA